MTFSEFAKVVGPSAGTPIAVDWDAVESWLKLRLPGDYKEVASTYGPLDIGGGLWLHTPITDDRNWGWDYTRWLNTTHRRCRDTVRLDVPTEVPAFHPAKGGLLAWGETRHGYPLFWDTSVSPDPEEWTTVSFAREFPYVGNSPWHRYEMSMTDFAVTAIRTGIDRGTRWGVGPLPPYARRPEWMPTTGRQWTAPVRRPRGVDVVRRAALRKGRGLEALAALVVPPAQPRLGETSWDEVAEQLGTGLPAEYRVLMERYGAGEWRGWLGFFGRDELVGQVETLTGFHRELREQFPQFEPLSMWPERGGFLPFATSIDGDELGWVTVGDPDGWPVLLVPHDDEPVPAWRVGLVDGLLGWARGYTPPGMPEADPLEDLLELAVFAAADGS